MLAILSFWNEEPSAFWGSDSADSASGLDLAAGFDVNTITTLTGTVMTPPEKEPGLLVREETRSGSRLNSCPTESHSGNDSRL